MGPFDLDGEFFYKFGSCSWNGQGEEDLGTKWTDMNEMYIKN